MTFEFDAEVICDACQGAGETERDTYGCDDSGPILISEVCAYCDGSGTNTVHMRPVDLDDLEVIGFDSLEALSRAQPNTTEAE